MDSYRINFDSLKPFKLDRIHPLGGLAGLYFIALTEIDIPYPFKSSKLIYIGMSEKRTNSIGSRLAGHLSGQSGNLGLYNYSKTQKVHFTYLNFDSFSSFWNRSVEDLESYFILDFASKYGAYPLCNNKSGFPDFSSLPNNYLKIDWTIYE